MSGPYDGQHAIVTGGGSGIGRAIALRLANGGASVGVIDLEERGAAETVREITSTGGSAAYAIANVADSAGVNDAIDEVVVALGAPSIVVNNAAISRGGRIQDIAEEDWDAVIAVNLRGCYLVCKAVVPGMVEREYGRIVNISSGTGVRVGAGTGPYAASKAGVIALTKSVAGEVARKGITANVVAPGLTDTPMTRGQFGDADALAAVASSGGIANPMRVVIQPEDIAGAVAFLALPESRYITGQTLHVNAGSYMP